jgi:hypothetical protein
LTLTEELLEQFAKLDAAQQQRLLNFARVMANTPQIQGEPGSRIILATGLFDSRSLDEMEAAIQEID